MAQVADSVIVQLEARLGRYEADIARADQKFDRAMGNIQKNALGTERIVRRAAGAMGAALAGVSAVALARGFLGIADEAKNLEAQLKLATRESGSFAQAQKDVIRIANEARVGLDATAQLYATFQRNSVNLAISQEEAARATETLSKSFKISGASATEADNATRQFIQGIQNGALRGDEFNSVMEQAPRLQKLIVQAFNETSGAVKITENDLRDLAEQGKITSGLLLRALTDRKLTEGIDAEFKQLPLTFDEAMVKVRNAAVTTFGAFDSGGEFSTALANFVSDGADGFGDMADAAEQFGIKVRSELAGAVAVGEDIYGAFEKIAGIIDYIADSRIGRFISRINDLAEAINPVAMAFNAIVGGETFQTARAQTQQRLQNDAQDRKWQKIFSGYDIQGNPLPGTPGAAPGNLPPAVTSDGGKAKKAPKSPLDADAFAREEAALNDRILSLKADALYNAEQSAAVELQRIEAEKQANIRDIANDERYTTAQKAKVQALTETVAALESAAVIAKRDEQVARDALDIRLSGLRNDEDLLRAQADLATNRKERRDIELRLLDLAYEQEKVEQEAIIASKEASDAQKKIAQARLGQLDQVYGARRTGVERDNESPLARYARGLRETDTQDRIEEYVVDELQHVQDGISNALAKAIGTKDPLITGLINLFIEQVIMRPIAEALSNAGGGGGGLGGVVAGIGALFGFASGGSFQIGGRGGTDRNLLSLNGRPIANVSRGETINVSNKPLGRGGGGQTVVQQTFVLDARYGITTPELLQYVNQTAAQEGQRAYTSAVRDTPVIMSRRQRFGG